MKGSLLAAVLISLASMAQAALVSKTVLYQDGPTTLEGYLAYNDASAIKRPAVIVVPDWMGPSDFSRGRADELAKMGYIALAADVYGKGVRPKDAKEAMTLVTAYKGNRALLRSRVEAALKTILAQAQTDASRVAIMGYCFGGTAALELARDGAPILGVVTFHGGLDTPTPQDAKKIKAHLLVLTGADDPHVPQDQIEAFEKEMKDAKVDDWQLVSYSGAVHAFAVPTAGNDPSTGAAYNARADHRSWQAMTNFFTEIFK